MTKTFFYRHCYILIFLGAFLLASCNLQMEKRRYRPGYHIEVVKRNNSESATRKMVKGNIDPKVPDFVVLPLKPDSLVVSTEPEKSRESTTLVAHENTQTVIKPHRKKKDLDSCDVIFMVSGKRVYARVVEITDNQVLYKLCDDLTGRLFTVKTKLIDNITLRNGEYFIPKDRVIVDKEKERKKSQKLFVMAIVAIAIAIVGFTFSFFIHPFGIIAFSLAFINFIFSVIVMFMDIKPGKYTPSFRTKFTWILALLAIILCIAAMVICFA